MSDLRRVAQAKAKSSPSQALHRVRSAARKDATTQTQLSLSLLGLVLALDTADAPALRSKRG